MYRGECGVFHGDCVVNELSRAVPPVQIMCPGGFIINTQSADEVLALSRPTDAEIDAVLVFLETSASIAASSLLERTPEYTYVHLLFRIAPTTSYCSKVVEKNRYFRLGYEMQINGVEQWQVGCSEQPQSERLLRDLPSLGGFKYGRITKTSWGDLITFSNV